MNATTERDAMTADQRMTEDYADTIAARVEELATGLDNPDAWVSPDGAEYGEGADDFYDHLSEWPLEVKFERGEPFSVLVTFGGPNAWLVRDRFGGDRVEVYWGVDHATRRGGAALRAVLDHFYGYVEGDA